MRQVQVSRQTARSRSLASSSPGARELFGAVGRRAAELDLAVSISVECGAAGARMTGGGFGGSAIALAPDGVIRQPRTEIDRQFSLHEYARPEMFVVRPSPGARRDG
ncbi:MAG TPA: hypothetical protein VF838_09815 [Trebonia sp.]